MPRVDLIGPDGATYDVEAGELEQALKLPGFQLAHPTSTLESIKAGFGKGATLGWSGKMAGQAAAHSADVRRRGSIALPDPNETAGAGIEPDENAPDPEAEYARAKAEQDANEGIAKASHPTAYGASEMGGTLATTAPAALVGGLPAQFAIQGGLGALQGAGYSDAATTRGVLGDSALGALLGVGAVGAGAAVSKGAQAVRANASQVVAQARARAAAEAAKKPAQILRSEISSLGGKTADLNNDLKWIDLLLQGEKAGTLSAGSRATLETLRSSPAFGAMLEKSAQRVAESAPSAVSKVAEQEAIVSGLQSALPGEIAAGTAARVAPSATASRAWGIAKRELSPVIGAYAGNEAAKALGGEDSAGARGLGVLAGGVFGAQYGRGRLGKSLTDLKNMPSTQILFNSIKSGAAALPEQLGKFTPALRAAAARGSDALAAAHFLLYNNNPEYRQGLDAMDKGSAP